MPANVKDREYRMINVSNLEIREEQDGKKVVEGYATTFDQEYRLWGDERYQVFESVDRHAFDNADMADVIMQYDHEGRVFARKLEMVLGGIGNAFPEVVKARTGENPTETPKAPETANPDRETANMTGLITATRTKRSMSEGQLMFDLTGGM